MARLESIYADWHDQSSRRFLHFADLSDSGSLWSLLYDIQPDEIYKVPLPKVGNSGFSVGDRADVGGRRAQNPSWEG